MAILFLLNGPPGIGKSTLARMFTQHHPLALNLDVDRVRSLLGGWAQQPSEAGLLARELSLGMARTHLGGGRHVVVPQHLDRLTFIEQLEHTTGQTGADFGEVMLMDERTNAVRRFEERTASNTEDEHGWAGELVERAGGRGDLLAMYDRLLVVLAQRPHTRVVWSTEGDVAGTYADLMSAVG